MQLFVKDYYEVPRVATLLKNEDDHSRWNDLLVIKKIDR